MEYRYIVIVNQYTVANMTFLYNKRILLGVSGGIAAYKSADLVRRLREAGADVRVVMTSNAEAFITPLTLQAVSGKPVHRHLLDAESESGMGHIDLARWADMVLIAPASANLMARLAHGMGDELLTTICLATSAPLAVAPAMNQQMWLNPATQENLETLRARGVWIFGPAAGDQACGEVGPGRMLEPLELVAMLPEVFSTQTLAGRRLVITAGPTWEALDPVRGFSNHSSGKMGYAVATAAREAGANVTLVSGPTQLAPPDAVDLIRVTSAQQMYDAVLAQLDDISAPVDVFIGVAAVADYRPQQIYAKKIKKSAATVSVELVRNPDILAAVAQHRRRPYTVGFAAETENVEQNAREKLLQKGVDLIAANLVGTQCGFGVDENALLLVERGGATELPMDNKARIARALVKYIAERLHAKNTSQNTRQAHR